jgi:hypothetical protein
MMAGTASLNSHQTWFKLLKKRQDLRPSQSTVERDISIVCDAVDLKNVLSQPIGDCFAIT